MRIDSGNGDRRQVRGEGFAFNRTHAAAIEGVADHGSQHSQGQMVDAAADFLIAGETEADGSVWNFGMSRQIRRRFHDDSDAGLVVTAEKRRAVRW